MFFTLSKRCTSKKLDDVVLTRLRNYQELVEEFRQKRWFVDFYRSFYSGVSILRRRYNQIIECSIYLS